MRLPNNYLIVSSHFLSARLFDRLLSDNDFNNKQLIPSMHAELQSLALIRYFASRSSSSFFCVFLAVEIHINYSMHVDCSAIFTAS
jgi:hypothetical protein